MNKKLLRTFCALTVTAMLGCAGLAETKTKTTVEYSPADEKTHDKIEETWTYNLDEDGNETSGQPAGITAVTEAHVFKDDKCTLCGYTMKDPKKDDKKDDKKDEEPAVTDTKADGTDAGASSGEEDAAESAIREVPAAEAVHGVSVAQNLDAVQTLTAVIDSLGENDEVRLADAENVFTADEVAKLNQQSAKEQILVLLSALGYDVKEPLSADAQALLDAIQTRTTPEALKDAFPAETLTIDGQAVECYTVTLAFNKADGEVLEHYTFRKDNGIFAKLTVEG